MAQREIREFDGKRLLAQAWDAYFEGAFSFAFQSVKVSSGAELFALAKENSWLNSQNLVVKPDMLFGKRGLNNLVFYKKENAGDVSLADAAQWIDAHSHRDITLKSGVTGQLHTFLVEPFCPHNDSDEYYIALATDDNEDILYISDQGGVNVEDNWDSVTEIRIPVSITDDALAGFIESHFPSHLASTPLLAFSAGFYRFFRDSHFSYLEINPIVFKGRDVFILDTVARLDDTAGFLMSKLWGDMEFPTPFGMSELSKEEQFIKQLDENSGASLKLTLLNTEGCIWTLVAGGGASVVYADTISDKWGIDDLANYGEYSGNPSQEETYHYAKTVIELMCRKPDAKGRPKILIIGGAIANFTDVAKTFGGIIQAFRELANDMRRVNVQIFVRRGGPNYETGLKNIEDACKQLGLPIDVHGPQTHITDIVRLALETPAVATA